VSQHNAPRLAGCAGGEEDLRDMAAGDGLIGENGNCGVQADYCVSMTGRLIQLFGDAGEILQEEGRGGGSEGRFRAGNESEFDTSIGGNAGGKIERRGIIEGNSDSAAQEAAPEGGDPFCGVSAPEENAVAGLKRRVSFNWKARRTAALASFW